MNSWRDSIKVHPTADLLPPLEPAALAELVDDIKSNGMLVPVVAWQDNDGEIWLIDGRNRLDALEQVGLPCVDEAGRFLVEADIRTWETDPVALVIGLNIRRRHLSAEQKRELIAKLIEADPQRSNRQVAALVGLSHPTVAVVRENLEAKGDVVKFSTSRDTLGRHQPARRPKGSKAAWRAGARRNSKIGVSRPSKVDEIVRDLHHLAGNGQDITPKVLLTAVTQQGKRTDVICSARLVLDWLDGLLSEAGSQHSPSLFIPTEEL